MVGPKLDPPEPPEPCPNCDEPVTRVDTENVVTKEGGAKLGDLLCPNCGTTLVEEALLREPDDI